MKFLQQFLAFSKKSPYKKFLRLASLGKKSLAQTQKSLRRNFIRVVDFEASFSNAIVSSICPSETILTPEAPSMPFYFEAKHLQSETYSLPIIQTFILSKAIYCSPYNILLNKSREIISESISTQKDPEQFSWKVLNFSKLSYLSGYGAVFRSYKNEYYHTLIDNLPRLYLLHHQDLQKIPEINLLCPGGLTKVEKFFLNKLLPNNVTIANLSDRECFEVENLIFPTFLSKRYAGCLPSYYLNWFIEKVAPKRPRQKVNRIFISRVPTQRGQLRCILNEDELFATLQKYGFKRYVLDNLSNQEQIELFYDAEFVVGSHGAGLSNLIFSQEIKVLELFPIPFVLPHYYYISKSLGHTYQYWCGQEKNRDKNFVVDTAQISEIIERKLQAKPLL